MKSSDLTFKEHTRSVLRFHAPSEYKDYFSLSLSQVEINGVPVPVKPIWEKVIKNKKQEIGIYLAVVPFLQKLLKGLGQELVLYGSMKILESYFYIHPLGDYQSDLSIGETFELTLHEVIGRSSWDVYSYELNEKQINMKPADVMEEVILEALEFIEKVDQPEIRC